MIPPGSPLRERSEIGALAQLGERLHGMQEVSGSIPLGSTKRFSRSERRVARQGLFEEKLPKGRAAPEIDIYGASG